MNLRLSKIIPFLILPIAISSCSEPDGSADVTPSTTVETEGEITTEVETPNTDGPFSIKSGVIHYVDKNQDGDITMESDFYFDNYGRVMKLEETVDGEVSVYLYDDDAKKGLTQFPGRNASTSSMKQGEILRLVAMRSQQGYVQQADEEIIGKNCEVYANNAVDENGDSKVVYWMHQGICLKEINQLGMGYIFEATSFEEKALDASVFALLNEN